MTLKRLLETSAIILLATTATACGGGSSGAGTVPPPTPTPPDTTAPTVSFNPTSLSVTAGATGSSTLTSTDNVAVTSGPTVSCTNGGSFAGSTFTAPAVTTTTTVECTATASDAAGNDGTATLTVTVTPDTTAPTVSFSPTTLTVASGATGAATLTASDDVDGTLTPSVSCTNGGSFAGNVFTAPAVTVDTTSVCTATATDAAGNSNTATLTVTIPAPPPDTTAPTISFNPTMLSVASGGTAVSTLTATDNVAITSGPTVSCTNGGSFNVSNNTFTAATVTANTTSICTATASDAAGNTNTATLTVTMTPAPSSVTISGKATYDFVPHTASNGLDYANTSQRPIKGTTVEALDSSGTVLVSGITDANGDYSLIVDPNTQVRIRVKAEMVQTSGAQWNVRVQDNTSPMSPIYSIAGSLTSSGAADSTRNLNAASGWTGSNSAGSYTGTRAAAPFAIIDPIYDGLLKFAAIDPDIVFPLAKFNWSTRNRAANGILTNGEIGTSSYRGNGDIYILGDADNPGVEDTDEYDDHVNVHEWGHYFEDQISRADSIGGPHSGGNILDPRVAMGEGFGNALSGIITDDPFYRDSFGARQASGFEINVETNDSAGWYDESTVQSVLYDIYDSGTETGDNLALGLGPIYETLTDSAYTGNSFFTTIFTFLDQLRTEQPGNVADINTMATSRNINGTGPDGAGETLAGGVTNSLPLYKTVTVNGPALQICSNNTNDEYNKLGNREFVRFNAVSTAPHTITMSYVSGPGSTNPEFYVYKDGQLFGVADEPPANTEVLTRSYNVGEHIIDAYDANNTDQTAGGGNYCFNLTVTR